MVGDGYQWGPSRPMTNGVQPVEIVRIFNYFYWVQNIHEKFGSYCSSEHSEASTQQKYARLVFKVHGPISCNSSGAVGCSKIRNRPISNCHSWQSCKSSSCDCVGCHFARLSGSCYQLCDVSVCINCFNIHSSSCVCNHNFKIWTSLRNWKKNDDFWLH